VRKGVWPARIRVCVHCSDYFLHVPYVRDARRVGRHHSVHLHNLCPQFAYGPPVETPLFWSTVRVCTVATRVFEGQELVLAALVLLLQCDSHYFLVVVFARGIVMQCSKRG
jgi:hypothetical protein